jgi:hypothetical protein
VSGGNAEMPGRDAQMSRGNAQMPGRNAEVAGTGRTRIMTWIVDESSGDDFVPVFAGIHFLTPSTPPLRSAAVEWLTNA